MSTIPVDSVPSAAAIEVEDGPSLGLTSAQRLRALAPLKSTAGDDYGPNRPKPLGAQRLPRDVNMWQAEAAAAAGSRADLQLVFSCSPQEGFVAPHLLQHQDEELEHHHGEIAACRREGAFSEGEKAKRAKKRAPSVNQVPLFSINIRRGFRVQVSAVGLGLLAGGQWRPRIKMRRTARDGR